MNDTLTRDITFYTEYKDITLEGGRAVETHSLVYFADDRMVRELIEIYGEKVKRSVEVIGTLELHRNVNTEDELIRYINTERPVWDAMMKEYSYRRPFSF